VRVAPSACSYWRLNYNYDTDDECTAEGVGQSNKLFEDKLDNQAATYSFINYCEGSDMSRHLSHQTLCDELRDRLNSNVENKKGKFVVSDTKSKYFATLSEEERTSSETKMKERNKIVEEKHSQYLKVLQKQESSVLKSMELAEEKFDVPTAKSENALDKEDDNLKKE
jgi:hypothetical protein